MSVKKLFEQYTPAEIADGFVLPVKLTAEQREDAARQLAEYRQRRRAGMTGTEKLNAQLQQLKFRLEDYIKNEAYNPQFTFGYFLEQYLRLTNRKKKEFAADIQIHETQLSQVLKNRREPSESMMIRLELHSNNAIPAIDWFKLLEKEKGHQIKTDRSLRERESGYVRRSLETV